MKKGLVLITAAALSAGSLNAQQMVNGYMRSDGTYVAPHMRSTPDATQLNNWSTQGNTNPYTGQEGTRSAFPSYPQGGSNAFGGGETRSGSYNRNGLPEWGR